jgi:hypothetical protein
MSFFSRPRQAFDSGRSNRQQSKQQAAKGFNSGMTCKQDCECFFNSFRKGW